MNTFGNQSIRAACSSATGTSHSTSYNAKVQVGLRHSIAPGCKVDAKNILNSRYNAKNQMSS